MSSSAGAGPPFQEANVAAHSTPMVQELTGASFRQLDWWARRGVLVPSIADANGSGTQRRYSDDDVRAVRVVRALAELGAKGRLLAGVPDVVRDLQPGDTHLVVTAEGEVTAWPTCVVHGGAAYVVDLIALEAHAGAEVALVDDMLEVV